MAKALKDVAVGDKVWISDGRVDRARIQTVIKLTPTQIVTDSNFQPRYHRGKPSRLRGEPTYYRIGGSGWHTPAITAIATEAEVEKWEAKQAEIAREREERARAIETRNARREELDKLFGRNASVGQGDKDGQWCVTLWLSEKGVRELAALLASSKQKKPIGD